jgi:HAE1 family hydrophobic/amphiphilic exporter-1
LIGGILAICVLLLFLRSVTSTVTTAVAIPISAIGTFIFMWLMGRNLNVVSLAGISFAVGMLVDNSIVVLENIDRHRKMGKKAMAAAHEGAMEVWGAVLASTATTVAVFLPVIFIQEEAGQLFRDIAIAITFSILLSLFVSVSVIPTLIHQFYKRKKEKKPNMLQKSYVGPEKLCGAAVYFCNNEIFRFLPEECFHPNGNGHPVYLFFLRSDRLAVAARRVPAPGQPESYLEYSHSAAGLFG